MPEPGSNRYDHELARQRHSLEEQGHPDAEADRLARKSMEERTRMTGPAASSERAGGPLGGRGGGDAGNAIDLRSPAFSPNALIPPEYTKVGDDVSPPLEWSNVPEGTAEVAVICEDPDAPTGTFRHWLLTGVDPRTTSLPKGERP